VIYGANESQRRRSGAARKGHGRVISHCSPSLPKSGRGQFKDLQEGVTLSTKKSTGYRIVGHVVADSPDEKRQTRDRGERQRPASAISCFPRHLMVQGRHGFPRRRAGQESRAKSQNKDITGGLRVWSNCSKPASRMKPRSSAKIDGTVKFGEVQGQRKPCCRPITARKKNTPVPRGVHINVQKASGVKAGERSWTARSTPPRISGRASAEKELQSYLVNEIQEVFYPLAGRQHLGQAHRSDCPQMMRW